MTLVSGTTPLDTHHLPVTKHRRDAAHHKLREAHFGFSPSLMFESLGT